MGARQSADLTAEGRIAVDFIESFMNAVPATDRPIFDSLDKPRRLPCVRSPLLHEPAEKTFLEFFAGIGLVEEGLRPSGWKCIYANDHDDRKRAMHAARNGPTTHYHLADVRNTDEILARIDRPPFLATASFPCTDLSLAGNYHGFGGRQSSTFFAFIDVIERLAERKPKLILLENVPGLLSARKGEDFRAVVAALARLGYWVDAFVLDARFFLPQSRPRVFVIALSSELRTSPLVETLPDDAVAAPETSALRPLSLTRFTTPPLPTGWVRLQLPLPPQRTTTLEDVIDLDEGQEWWSTKDVERHHRMMSERHRKQVDLFLASNTSFVGTVFRRVRRDGQRAEVRFDGLAGCLRTPRGGSGRQIVVAVADGRLRMRWMSPREYARLQGAPDFPVEGPTNPLLFGFGDAVCVPAIRWIDRHALTPLYEAFVSCRAGGVAGAP